MLVMNSNYLTTLIVIGAIKFLSGICVNFYLVSMSHIGLGTVPVTYHVSSPNVSLAYFIKAIGCGLFFF